MSRMRLRRTQRHSAAGAGVQGGGGGGVSYDAAATTLFAAMSVQPDATRKGVINTMITSLKSAGIWSKLDWLCVFAAHDSQAALLNWITPGTRDATAVNAPTFTTDQGYAGNGSTSYLNTNFVPSTHGVNYTLNDCSFGVYSRTNSAANVRDAGAANASSANLTFILARFGDDKLYYDINSIGSFANVAVASSAGLTVVRRTASDAMQAYRNGSQVATATHNSQARPSVALYIGAFNNNGSASAFSTRQYALGFIAAAMTTQQQADFYTISQAYLTAIGANV